MKKIAICMTIYNRDGIYSRSLKNLFEQNYKNVKFYVVDDCSTDDGLRRLVLLNQNAPDIFKLFQTDKRNYIDAMNLALKSVEEDCDYIAWCDSDDFISNEKLQMQADFLDNNPDVDVVACTTAFGKNQVLAPSRVSMTHADIEKLLKENNGMNTVCHFQSCMFRRSVLRRFSDKKYFYDEYIGGRAGEGFLYTLFFCGCKFASINSCAYFYNIGAEKNSMTNTIIPVYANDINKLQYSEKRKTILNLLRKYNKPIIVKTTKAPTDNKSIEPTEMPTTATPKRRGRPKKVVTPTEMPTTAAPRRRGRPKKVKTE